MSLLQKTECKVRFHNLSGIPLAIEEQVVFENGQSEVWFIIRDLAALQLARQTAGAIVVRAGEVKEHGA